MLQVLRLAWAAFNSKAWRGSVEAHTGHWLPVLGHPGHNIGDPVAARRNTVGWARRAGLHTGGDLQPAPAETALSLSARLSCQINIGDHRDQYSHVRSLDGDTLAAGVGELQGGRRLNEAGVFRQDVVEGGCKDAATLRGGAQCLAAD